MANWENIRTGAVRAANKTIKKTGELAEITSMHLKLTALNAKRDGMFEKLGRLTYKQLKSGESQAEAIAPIVATIDKLNVQITKQKASIEEAKAERAKAKQEMRAAEAQSQAQSEQACADSVKNIIDEGK